MSEHESAISTRLANDMVDAFDDWLEECARVRDASGQLSTARGADRAMAFAAYMAALDREERAAGSYESSVRRAGVPSRQSKAAPLQAA